jgi:hypothetical protein
MTWMRLSEAVEALTSPELTAGWWCGLVALAIGMVAAVLHRSRSWPAPVPILGFLFGGAVLVAVGLSLGWPAGLALGLLVLASAGVAGQCMGAGPLVNILLVVPGAWLVLFQGVPQLAGWPRLLTMMAVVVGGWLLADFNRRWQRAGLAPVLLAISVAGVYTTVPDTEQALAALGAALPLTLLGWPWPLASLGQVGAYVAAGTLLWVVSTGGMGRASSVIGGVACLGLLAVEPLARGLHPDHRSVVDCLPIGWRVPAVATLHLGLVYVAARVVGLRPSATQAGVLAGLGLVGAVLLALAATIVRFGWSIRLPQ